MRTSSPIGGVARSHARAARKRRRVDDAELARRLVSAAEICYIRGGPDVSYKSMKEVRGNKERGYVLYLEAIAEPSERGCPLGLRKGVSS